MAIEEQLMSVTELELESDPEPEPEPQPEPEPEPKPKVCYSTHRLTLLFYYFYYFFCNDAAKEVETLEKNYKAGQEKEKAQEVRAWPPHEFPTLDTSDTS